MGSGRAVAVAAVVVALTGCATVSLPEPGFTDEEWAQIMHRQGDQSWEYFGFPAELQPPYPPMELVPSDDYSARFAGCMNDAGFDNYLPDGTVLFVEEEGAGPDGLTDPEAMASYDCSMRIVVRPEDSGMLNRRERDYWYDYYEQSLVPCLIAHDIGLFEVQDREEFHESYGWWNPYYAVRQKDQKRVNGNVELRRECSPVPPGVKDPGYYGLYG